MIFVTNPGGKLKRLKGKRGGDKNTLSHRSRKDDRRYTVECFRASERKSLRRTARVGSDDIVIDEVEAAGAPIDGRQTFLTDNGETRVTLVYTSGRVTAAHARRA